MKRQIHWLFTVAGAVLFAACLGIGSAWWAVLQVPGSFQTGPWRHDPLTGSADAGLYFRARVAKRLPFALSNSEAIYLVAATDTDGNELSCNDTYRIDGRDIEARWWSITCYGTDGFLISNRQDRYSYNMTNLDRNADGTYTIRVSRSERTGNWLPTGNGESFLLVLRLYDATAAVRKQLGTINLPTITREDISHEQR
jgi:hypothetical protein